ncbi:restriction endonuclease subunit S [Carnobacterium divergens]|uniref:restriction endonuclease subunit S n=1 Tax=Carnobacterium divergens TaxID=2748 RepID=UPI00128E0BC7|nr:restriction endonuclease subunit S [Carnobacterium divergens]MPQ23315.1 restriction endonuclease subunit S [Carnobacterium divergens]
MKKNKVPEIRFSGFTDDWELRKLGDIGSVAMCKRIFKEETSDSGEIPFYKIGTFGGEPDAYISRELFEEYKSEYPYPQNGDLLISASGSIGRIVEYKDKDEYFQDSNIVWLKHDNQIINSFLKQFYGVVKWKGLEGSTIKRLYNKNILETEIMIPSTDEQMQVGNFFKTLDNTITLHQRELEILKNTKKGFLQKMFPKEGKKVPEVRFSGFTNDWEQYKLGELGKTQSGIGFSDAEQGGSEGIPFYKVSDMNNVGNENEMTNANNYVSDEQIKRKKWKPIETVPAVMFAKVGAAIMLNRKRLVTSSFLIDNNTMAYVFDESWDIDFGKTLFETIHLPRHAQVGALPSYNGSDIESIDIKVPIKDEQQKIGNFFKQLDNTITIHQRELTILQNTKKAFLQKMFV